MVPIKEITMKVKYEFFPATDGGKGDFGVANDSPKSVLAVCGWVARKGLSPVVDMHWKTKSISDPYECAWDAETFVHPCFAGEKDVRIYAVADVTAQIAGEETPRHLQVKFGWWYKSLSPQANGGWWKVEEIL